MPDKKAMISEKLTRNRRDLFALLQPLDQQQWQTVVFSEDASWTVADILGHLADSERGMTRLMEQIVEGKQGVPPDFDLHRWNARAVAKAREKSPAEVMAEMEQNQAALLNFIDTLSDEDWDKTGRHASLRIMSIEEICNLIADHEALHTGDIRRALAGK